jgi:hypothetical protein
MFGLGKKANAREIFEYWDGEKKRRADPVAIWRAMAAHPQFVADKHLQEIASSEQSLQIEASDITVRATREIFGIAAWSETNDTGLTEFETLEVLNQFMGFIDGLKKNGDGQPT